MEAYLIAVGGAAFITVVSVMSAFWQIPVGEKDQDATAFVTHKDKYVFLRMPFGVRSAPWLF